MQFATILALTAAVGSAIDIDELHFMNYLSKYGKQYESLAEFVLRKEIYIARNVFIREHNSRPSNFTLGHNIFSDWKPEEMASMLGDKSSEEAANAYCLAPPSDASPVSLEDLPASVNWVEAGMTTPVKDQGQCGSCWSFASTETVESANAIFGSGLVSLSEQQLVECVTADNGCGGGMTYDSYTYYMSHKAYLDADWPYTATDDAECTYKESEAADISLSTYVCVQPQTPAGMKPAVAQQPVAISIDAGS